MQFYDGNLLAATITGRGGKVYDRHEEFYVDERMKEPMHRMTRHVAAKGASAPADR